MDAETTQPDIEKTLLHNELRHEWMPAFIAALTQSPNVSKAAKLAGINRQYAYFVRGQDPVFQAAWDDAIEQGTDELEDRAYELAKAGTQGISPVLLIFLLKGRRREIYGDQVKAQVDSNINLNGSITLYMPQNGREAEGENDGSE